MTAMCSLCLTDLKLSYDHWRGQGWNGNRSRPPVGVSCSAWLGVGKTNGSPGRAKSGALRLGSEADRQRDRSPRRQSHARVNRASESTPPKCA